MNGLACGRRNVSAGAQPQGFYLSSGNRLAVGAGGIFTCLPLPSHCHWVSTQKHPWGRKNSQKTHEKIWIWYLPPRGSHSTEDFPPSQPHIVGAHPQGQSSLGWVSHEFVGFVLKMLMCIETHLLCIKNVIKTVSPFVISWEGQRSCKLRGPVINTYYKVGFHKYKDECYMCNLKITLL